MVSAYAKQLTQARGLRSMGCGLGVRQPREQQKQEDSQLSFT
jgi:hypothetical protein